MSMPRITEERAAEQRRRILNAAAGCFAKDGLFRATVDDIAIAAGVSKGALYGYFASKEDMIAALKVESVQRDAAVVRAATQAGTPEQAAAAMLSGVIAQEEAVEGRRMEVQLWSESIVSRRLLDAQLLETQLWADAFELVVQEAQRTGQVNDGVDARSVAWTLAAIRYGATAIGAWDPEFDASQVTEVVRAMLDGHLGPADAQRPT